MGPQLALSEWLSQDREVKGSSFRKEVQSGSSQILQHRWLPLCQPWEIPGPQRLERKAPRRNYALCLESWMGKGSWEMKLFVKGHPLPLPVSFQLSNSPLKQVLVSSSSRQTSTER